MANDVTEKAFSDLDTASQLDNTDIFALSKVSGSGYISAKTSLTALATKIATATNYTSELQTTSKTLTGAINEIAQGGGGGGTDVIADDFSTESTYVVGDYVIYSGSLYKCTTAVTTAGAWDSTKWTETLVMDEVEAGGGGGSSWTDVTGTLTAGSTSITLSNVAITTTSTIEVFNDLDVPYNSKTLSTGSITLTFDAQSSDMSVKVRVS